MKLYRILCLIISLILILSLAGACTKNDETTADIGVESALIDGTYSAKTKYYDNEGYGAQLTLVVVDGFITKVNFSETNMNGQKKTDLLGDIAPWPSAETDLSKIYSALYTSLIQRQSAEIDTVTGATITSNLFKALAEVAVDNAATGEIHEAMVNDYTQTYTVYGKTPSIEGENDQLTIVYEGDTMVQVNFEPSSESSLQNIGGNTRQFFQTLSKDVLKQQSLDPIVLSDPAFSNEVAQFNTLLSEISAKRKLFL